MSRSLEAITASLHTSELSSNYKALESKIKNLTFIRGQITFRSVPSRGQVSALHNFVFHFELALNCSAQIKEKNIHTKSLPCFFQAVSHTVTYAGTIVTKQPRVASDFLQGPEWHQTHGKSCLSFLSSSDQDIGINYHTHLLYLRRKEV